VAAVFPGPPGPLSSRSARLPGPRPPGCRRGRSAAAASPACCGRRTPACCGRRTRTSPPGTGPTRRTACAGSRPPAVAGTMGPGGGLAAGAVIGPGPL